MLKHRANPWGAAHGQAVAIAALTLLSILSVPSAVPAQTTQNPSLSTAESAVAGAGSQVAANKLAQLEGQIEITYQDFKDGRHKLSYALKRPDGTRVPLQFQKDPPRNLLTGDHVRASGQLSGGSLVLYSGSNVTSTTTSGDATGSTASSIPVPNTFGAQYTLVMLVNFQDDAIQPYTVAQAQSMFFSTASNFFLENSYGQTWLTGDVVGWYTMPVSVTTCDLSQIASDANNAATAAGVNLSSYTRYVYAFPYDSACGGMAGASTVGGNPSQSWVTWNSPGAQLIDHELGHAFGLWHSHALDCGTVTICSAGTIVEYGDNIDTMGYPQGPSPDYNAFQKERLGWLNYGASPKIQTVTASGTYTITPYESGSGPNALKILQSTNPTTGAKTWYYLEARQAVGFDSFLTDGTCPACYTQNETAGVLFHLGTDGDGNSGDLLAMTPSNPPPGWYDDSLVVGQGFQDPAAGVTFVPTAVTASGASVQITFGSCIPSNPSVGISPAQGQYVSSGTAVSFTTTVTDNDTSACPATTFNLADVVPSGWAGAWSSSTLSLSPGKSGSATLIVTSPAGTADGSYNVAVSATNASSSSYGGSATAAYLINSAPLSVSLTTNQSSYLPGQTVAISVSLLYGTSPDAGASVTAMVTAPNGRTTSLSGTTGANGVALLSYKLSKNAVLGTYPVQAQAGAASSTGGGGGRHGGGTAMATATLSPGASTSFTVQ